MKIIKLFIIVSLFIYTNSCSPPKSDIKISALFSDNMILQQKTETTIWGTAAPETEIIIETSWNKNASVKANEKGKWSAKFETPEAGGPYKINVKTHDDLISFSNVMSGEVWICAGQSNMGYTLAQNDYYNPKNIEKELNKANYKNIRLFTVKRNISTIPLDSCSGNWKVCDSLSASDFSAVAYFFGKELHKKLDIPIGLIHASWGGTPIEAWTSEKYLNEIDDYNSLLEEQKNKNTSEKKYNKWLDKFKKTEIKNLFRTKIWKKLKFDDSICSQINFDDSKLQKMNLPGTWEKSGLRDFNGVVWFRKKIIIPENFIGENLYIELGPIDDMDVTFFNGKKIGSYETLAHWQTNRIYKIPASLIISGKENLIAVKVIDVAGAGGMFGRKQNMRIFDRKTNAEISISGEWLYIPVAEYKNKNFHKFGTNINFLKSRPDASFEDQNAPTVLYKGMISPLIPFSAKGIIWYQGESNVYEPHKYRKLFSTLIKNWRNDRQQNDLPFYFVQIAPFKYSGTNNTESAELREAQFQTLNIKNTGMAVTLDIGSLINIHPAKKQITGKRLALWALSKTYKHDKIIYTGPLYKSMKIEENKIRIYFYPESVGSGLILKNRKLKFFQISGKDKKFVNADVVIQGNELIISSKKVKNPIAVRYAFKNGAKANFFNKENLPATSFRTDN